MGRQSHEAIASRYHFLHDLIPKAITGPVARAGAAAQNALEVARFGGLETGEEPSPFDVVAEHRVYRLRRGVLPSSVPAPYRINAELSSDDTCAATRRRASSGVSDRSRINAC